MEVHEAAKIMPAMTDGQYAELKADIEKHGLREPVVLYEGKILDGRHRWRACEELDIKPDTMQIDAFSISGDPYAYVISVNVHRRHFTESQRAMLGANLVEHYAKEAKARQAAAGGAEPGSASGNVAGSAGEAREQAAEVVNVGARTMQKAVNVVNDGAKVVADAVAAGTINVTTAERLVKAVPDKADQSRIVREAAKAEAPDKAVREAIGSASFDPAVIHNIKTATRKPRSGSPAVSIDVRKKVHKCFGDLVRALKPVGLYEKHLSSLDAIARDIKSL